MFVEAQNETEVPRSSFKRKNNNYRNCPLKKRPVNVALDEEVVDDLPQPLIKEENIENIAENVQPENLSTKPQDLSPVSRRDKCPPLKIKPEVLQPMVSPSVLPSSPVSYRPYASQPYHHQTEVVSPSGVSPPPALAPVQPPVAKKARVEVIQHDNSGSSPNFFASKPPAELASVESLSHYASWMRAPVYPSAYLPYPLRYLPDLYSPPYPVPGYPFSSPEHQSISPSPPHASLTCQPTIARPVAQWPSPEPLGLTPPSSVNSPQPITPEDLSSPGSDSGRSSAGSTSAGSADLVVDKSPVSPGATKGSPRYQCPGCAKSYSTYSGMTKHQQYHCAAAEGQLKKTFTCKFCQKLYTTLGALKMHIRTHTLPCKCHLCGKCFSRPWLLQGHIRTHTGEKPFSCQHCKRAFADRSNLRAHLQTHSDVKKYSCATCSKTFSRMSLLVKHQEGGCPGVGAVPIGYAR